MGNQRKSQQKNNKLFQIQKCSSINRHKSAYKPKSLQQFLSSQPVQSPEEIFQSKVNLLENKVSDFLLEYLKTFYSSNIHAEEDLTRTLLQVQTHHHNGKLDIKPKLYIIP